MNNFELFSMMFFELDFVFEKQTVKDDFLAMYLSEINPFCGQTALLPTLHIFRASRILWQERPSARILATL